MMNSKIVNKIYLFCMSLVAVMIVTGILLCQRFNFQNYSASYIRDIAVDAMGMFIGGALLIGIYAEKNKDYQNHSMFRMIFSLIALFYLNLLTSFIEGDAKHKLMIIIVNSVAFIFEDLLGYVYWAYIKDELKLSGRFLNVANKICKAALLINILLDLLNIKFGMFFTVSDSGEYIDSPYEFLGDIAILIIFVISMMAIFRYSNSTINKKLVLITFVILPMIAYALGDYSQEYTWVYPSYLFSILLIYIRIFGERGKKIAEQEVVLTKQSTALMISQIQPHFLYNVLTTISNLCVTDPEEAEETTVLFSQYLRTNLDSLRNQEPVPFSTELGHIKTYVELEKKRFGDILNVEYDINEVNFNVPALGLQPIVENSIKHGIRGKNDKGNLKIGTYKADNGYKVVIEDDGIGFDMNEPVKEDGKSHVGMINVKERLYRMCNATMEVDSAPGKGCRTEIFIPSEKAN